MTAILLAIVIVGAVVGLALGLFRRFSRTSFLGATVLLTLLIVNAVASTVTKESDGYGISVLIAAMVSLVAFTVLFKALQKFIAHRVKVRKELSHYKNSDKVEESDELILSSLDSGDKRQYKKELRKRKRIKERAGVWGWLDAIFGAIFGALNFTVILGTIALALIMFADVTQIAFLTGAFGEILESEQYLSMLAPIAFDMVLLVILALALRTGYKNGILGVLSTVIVLALAALFGYASWAIASSSSCAGVVESIKTGMLAGVADMLGETADLVATVILTAFIFLLSLVFVIIAAIFLPKLFDKLRENKAVSTVDGVIGAIVMTAVVLGLLMVFGGIAYTLYDLPFMESVTFYADLSSFTDALYAFNPLGALFEGLPLRDWFTAAA